MAVVLPGSFIYLPHVYTGEVAIATALKSIEGAFDVVDKRKGIGTYSSLKDVRAFCGDRLTGEEIVFTSIRYPYPLLYRIWQRMLNHSQVVFMEKRLGRDATFQEFWDLWVELDTHPFLKNGRIFFQDAKHVVRAETLQNDLNRILRQARNCPQHSVKLPRHNSSDMPHWSGQYTDQMYMYVNEHFTSDFVQFGYPFVWSRNPLT